MIQIFDVTYFLIHIPAAAACVAAGWRAKPPVYLIEVDVPEVFEAPPPTSTTRLIADLKKTVAGDVTFQEIVEQETKQGRKP